MCQQKVLNRYTDPRYAVTMTTVQTAIARGKAGTIDVMSTPLRHNQRQLGVRTEILRNFASIPIPGSIRLVLFREPLKADCQVTSLRFALSQFGHSKLALVAAQKSDSNKFKIRIVAWGHMGDLPPGSSTPSSAPYSSIEFEDISPSWWTVRRHLEADILPPAMLKQDETWGLFFAEDLPTLSMTRDGSLPQSLILGKKSASLLPSFDELVAAGSFEVSQNEFQPALVPIMNLVSNDK